MASSHEYIDREVPGTFLLVSTNQKSTTHTQSGDIVLHPQPSDDPNDPLNRSQREKIINISMVYLYALAIGICTAANFSIMTQISETEEASIADLNLGTGLMQLMQGWANLLWQPIAMTYGRRLVYVVTIVLSIGPVIWVPLGHGSGQWYAHRILLGLLCSSVEALPELSVQDLFFAHERGKYMAFYTFVLFGSNFLAPFLAGFITNGLNWQWVMYLATIFVAICAIVNFFFLEETIFFRKETEGVEVTTDEKVEKADTKNIEAKDNTDPAGTDGIESVMAAESVAHKTGLKRLALITKLPGRPTPRHILWKSLHSLKIPFLFPNILWAGLLYGANIALYSVINATTSMILGSSPYNFEPRMVGVAYLSPFFFGGAASIWAGKITDSLVIKLAKRNGGVREPEHRLWGLAISGLMASGGMLMWGVGASQSVHYMILIIGIGITTFGVVCASAISLSYAVDCFKEMAGESFVTIIIIRNSIAFAFSYAITPWIQAMGLRDCFITVSMITLFCTFTFIAVIFWGKSWRRFSAKYYWRFIEAENQASAAMA